VGSSVGLHVGIAIGNADVGSTSVGLVVVRALDGISEDNIVEGKIDGETVVAVVGFTLGSTLGIAVGDILGTKVGCDVGLNSGESVGC